MKSIEDLKALRRKILAANNLQAERTGTRVVVGLATCGIAAGARPVLEKFQQEVQAQGAQDVIVSQTGCIGVCRLEPIVEVYKPGCPRVTYVKMTADKVAKVVSEHVMGGNPVQEYTIGYYEASIK